MRAARKSAKVCQPSGGTNIIRRDFLVVLFFFRFVVCVCVGLVGIRIEMYSYGLYGMCVTGTAGPAAPVDVMPQLLYARWPPLSTKGGQFELRRRTFGQDTHDSSS